MTLYDYTNLLAESLTGKLSNKQIQEIVNSPFYDFFIDDSEMPNAFMKNKKQNENAPVIIVEKDDDLYYFTVPHIHYTILIKTKTNEISFMFENKGKFDLKSVIGVSPEKQVELFKVIKACIAYHMVYNQFKILEYCFIPVNVFFDQH